MPTWINPAKYEELYKLGYSDPLISAKLGCSEDAVLKWRKRNHLPPNMDNLSGMLATLRERGIFDMICIKDAIINALGWHSEDVLQLTILKDKLLIEKASRREPQEKKTINSSEAMRLYKLGYSDKRIALSLEVNVSSVSGWRYRRNLSPNRVINPPIDEVEAERLFSLGYDDKMIAAELGVQRNVVYRWRVRKVRI
jgi:uncharacterized protein YjcR